MVHSCRTYMKAHIDGCCLLLCRFMRTGGKASQIISLQAVRTVWWLLPMRMASGTTCPATTICPTSARKAQVGNNLLTSPGKAFPVIVTSENNVQNFTVNKSIKFPRYVKCIIHRKNTTWVFVCVTSWPPFSHQCSSPAFVHCSCCSCFFTLVKFLIRLTQTLKLHLTDTVSSPKRLRKIYDKHTLKWSCNSAQTHIDFLRESDINLNLSPIGAFGPTYAHSSSRTDVAVIAGYCQVHKYHLNVLWTVFYQVALVFILAVWEQTILTVNADRACRKQRKYTEDMK